MQTTFPRAAFFALDKVPGFKRQFSLTDTSYVMSSLTSCRSATDVVLHNERRSVDCFTRGSIDFPPDLLEFSSV